MQKGEVKRAICTNLHTPCSIFLSCVLWLLHGFGTTAPLSAQTGQPIQLGGTFSGSGKYAEPSGMIRNGYRLWVSNINKQGGLLGRQVKLVLYDDQSRVDLVRSHYSRLISEDRVDLLVSPYGSPLTLAASEVSEANQRVMVASSSAAEMVWSRGYNYLFGVYSTAPRYFIGFLDLIARHNRNRLAVLYENSLFHQEVAAGVSHWAKRFGINMVLKQGFADTLDDTEQAVTELRNSRPPPEVVIVSAYPEAGYHMLRTLQEAIPRPPVFAMTILPIHPDFYKRVGSFAEGVLAPSQWEPDERIPFPGTRQFIADHLAFTGIMPSYHSGSAYASCQILEKAVRKSGSLDHHKLRDIIASMDAVTVIGRFRVNSKGMQIGHNPILIQWQQGRKVIVYPTRMQTAAPKM